MGSIDLIFYGITCRKKTENNLCMNSKCYDGAGTIEMHTRKCISDCEVTENFELNRGGWYKAPTMMIFAMLGIFTLGQE